MLLTGRHNLVMLYARDQTDHVLDLVMSMFFLLRKYNFVCETQEHGEVHSDSEFQIVSDFLNHLFRFRGQLSRTCDRDNFQPYYDLLIEWAESAEFGFELDDVEWDIYEAWNLRKKVPIADLVCDSSDEDGFVFVAGKKRWQLSKDLSRRPGIVLRFGFRGSPEDKQQLNLPLFRHISGFAQIEEAPVLSALHELTGRLLNPEVLQSLGLQSNGPNATPDLVSTLNPPKIVWNKDLGKLTLNGNVVRSVRSAKTAKGIVSILDAFHEANWALRVAPKFNGDEQRREAIRSLNKNLTQLVFEADGNDGVRWKLQSVPHVQLP